jgi:hypothetical protein
VKHNAAFRCPSFDQRSRLRREQWRYEAGPHLKGAPMPANADWGKVLGCDDRLAGALIDRLVHHSRVLNLKGKSYRLRSRTPGTAKVGRS